MEKKNFKEEMLGGKNTMFNKILFDNYLCSFKIFKQNFRTANMYFPPLLV